MLSSNIYPLVANSNTKKFQILLFFLFSLIGFLSIYLGDIYDVTIHLVMLMVLSLLYKYIVFTYKKNKLDDLHAQGKKIKLTMDGIGIIDEENKTKFYSWEIIKNVEFNIVAYDQEEMFDRGQSYTGNENSIIINTNLNEQIILDFYIKERVQFEDLVFDLKYSILPAAYRLKKVIFENVLFIHLNYNEKQLFKEQYSISHYSGKIHYK